MKCSDSYQEFKTHTTLLIFLNVQNVRKIGEVIFLNMYGRTLEESSLYLGGTYSHLEELFLRNFCN